jgi:molybdate transport repressor ModE-like protein
VNLGVSGAFYRSTEPPRSTEIGPLGRRSTAHLQRVLDPMRLRLLLAVDRLGSITRAAEACSMGQPTASTHLRTLESAVGHRLVERAGRGTRLTDAGRLLASHATVVVATLEELETELAALDRAVTGSLTLSSCDTFGNYVLPAALVGFGNERPLADIHVRIEPSGDVVRSVARDEAHLGIAGKMRRTEPVVAEPLIRDELAWVTAARSGVRGVVKPADVPGLTLIVPGRESSTRAITERILGGVKHRPTRVLELGSVEAIKRAVRSGVGVALLSRLAVADELEAGELCRIELLGAPATSRMIEIVRRENRPSTPLERAFERVLRLFCAQLSGQLGPAPRPPVVDASSPGRDRLPRL